MTLECSSLVDSIYCYDGYMLDNNLDINLYSLPLTDFSASKSMIDLAQTWILINNTNTDYIIEKRRYASAAVYGNNLLSITGGYTYNNISLRNQAIVYHKDTNTWRL